MLLSPSLVLLLACGEEPEPAPSVEEPADSCETQTWFLDADGDGYGGTRTLEACEAPSGYVADDSDCDDLDAEAFPGALSLFTDADGDGFGDPGSPVEACVWEEGLSEDASDCDDSAALTFPGADETCDGVDNDCDGLVDGLAVPGDFATIQEAVDAADDGGLVCVDAGTYEELVTIEDKAVRLFGAGSGLSVLEANGAASAALALDGADGARVVGFTIQGAAASLGAVRVDATAGAELEDLEITDNSCATYSCQGFALNIDLSIVDLVDVRVDENSADQGTSVSNYGYGAFRSNASDVVWLGGSVSANTFDVGYDGSTSGSSYSYAYGPIYVYNSVLVLQDVEILDNVVATTADSDDAYGYAYSNGPLYFYGSQVQLDEVVVEGNLIEATGSGGTYGNGVAQGGFIASVTRLDWTGGSLSDNRASAWGNAWAATYLANASQSVTRLVDLELSSNTAIAEAVQSTTCHGLYTYDSDIEWRRVDLRDNRLICEGPGYATALVHDYYGDSYRENVVVAGNQVQSGATTYALLNAWYHDATWSNATVHGNEVDASATYGLMNVWYGNSVGSLELHNSSVTGNTVTVDDSSSTYPAAAVLNGLYGAAIDLSYSDFHDNGSTSGASFVDYGSAFDPIGSDGNLDVAPGYTSTSGGPAAWDLTLASGSALIDAGSPSLEDPDGSVSDIGAYGGPEAW